MLFLILAMGLLNIVVGLVLAIQLGFGPPTFRAVFESLGPIPEADEVAEVTDENDKADRSAKAANVADASLKPTAAVAASETKPTEAVAKPNGQEEAVLNEVRALGDGLAVSAA